MSSREPDERPSSQWSAAFAGASADAMRIYDEIFVPSVFTPWAKNLIESIEPEPGCDGLDVACGPGSVTRVLARRIGPKGKVTAADISPAMLDIARSKAPEGDSAPIE